jgi:hypothetical protein
VDMNLGGEGAIPPATMAKTISHIQQKRECTGETLHSLSPRTVTLGPPRQVLSTNSMVYVMLNRRHGSDSLSSSSKQPSRKTDHIVVIANPCSLFY